MGRDGFASFALPDPRRVERTEWGTWEPPGAVGAQCARCGKLFYGRGYTRIARERLGAHRTRQWREFMCTGCALKEAMDAQHQDEEKSTE